LRLVPHQTGATSYVQRFDRFGAPGNWSFREYLERIGA
jgi:hypothetical protein